MEIIFQYRTKQDFLNKQEPLHKQQRREAGSFVDQDQQYFLIKRKTKCKADRTAQRVILKQDLTIAYFRF